MPSPQMPMAPCNQEVLPQVSLEEAQRLCFEMAPAQHPQREQIFFHLLPLEIHIRPSSTPSSEFGEEITVSKDLVGV